MDKKGQKKFKVFSNQSWLFFSEFHFDYDFGLRTDISTKKLMLFER